MFKLQVTPALKIHNVLNTLNGYAKQFFSPTAFSCKLITRKMKKKQLRATVLRPIGELKILT
jgi:hypothetical protein